MGLNAIGAYGFLAKAHIGHAVAGETAAAGREAEVGARITVQAQALADLDRRIAQIDGAVEKATAKGRTSAATALADQQRQARRSLTDERNKAAAALWALQVERAAIEGERKVAEADLVSDSSPRCSAPIARRRYGGSCWSWHYCSTQRRCCCSPPRAREGDRRCR